MKAIIFLGCFAFLSAQTEIQEQIKGLSKTNKVLTDTIGLLGRQLMLQQLAAEEKIRSDGDSGIKQVRAGSGGTKPYHAASHVGSRVVAIHNHANNIRTVGMGEFVGVLNGVEFRTRHNDYRLRMPHRTSKAYHAMENIPFPRVPPAVLQKATLDEQITEMREWFKAWKNSDHSKRDYRPYFKPVLSYLEGSWTISGKNIEEPFFSDRHFIDASSWMDLQEKIRFTAYSGRKSLLENYSYLPTTIMNLKNGTIPEIAQWNYRIAVHPIQGNIPLDRLRLVDELAPRMSSKSTIKRHIMSRAARFQLNPVDSNKFNDKPVRYGMLDTIMEQIPGKDNYKANLVDDAFDLPATKYGRGATTPLNAGYYHRMFKTQGKDAMGTSYQHRGYSDASIFMAMTTQPKVAPMTVRSCQKKVCKSYTQRWSYAIPMEIIYLTPLLAWNPYNLTYRGDSSRGKGRIATLGGRNGATTPDKAYNGINGRIFYQTPVEFYSGKKTKGRDPADTAKGAVGVLDPKGVVRMTSATGTHITLPSIDGVGTLRIRYPVMPVHTEGSTVWKELSALKDMVMEQNKYLHMYTNLPASVTEKQAALAQKGAESDVTFELGYSEVNPHTHTVRLSADEMSALKAGKSVFALTSEIAGHSHNIEIKAWGNRPRYIIVTCDAQKRCSDRHPKLISIVDE